MHVAIIGNGISGITAARHIRKLSNHDITVISSESDFFFSRTALMYIYMGHMKFEHTKPYEDWFWKKNNIRLLKKHVKKVDVKDKHLIFSDGGMLDYDVLIIASGSKTAKYGWKGQDLIGVQGLYSLQDLENIEKFSQNLQRAVIVGGGLIGIEMAEMFHSRHIPVTFLVREKHYGGNVLPKEEAQIITREIVEHGIDLRLETELSEILGDANGKVRGVITSKGEEISCQFVGITTGVTPNIDFLKDSGININKGVLVNEFFETNIPNVYAIGDCAEFLQAPEGRKKIEQVWYTGKAHGETLAKTICGKKTMYKPSVWFNSAKFFNIEYQTYGYVPAKETTEHESILWQKGKKLIRLVFEKESKKFLGVNVLGIRYRHEVLDSWIKNQKSINYVLQHLSEANFDPEFFKKHESELIEIYNQQNPLQKITTQKKKRLFFW
ncbi:MAG: FAD-dependent oxidoreductase [Flammeovirgaceae bacterium]